MLSVSLLGRLRIRFGGSDLRFIARPKVTPLLGYVLLHSAQPVSRDACAFALWPDDAEDVARANLRRHLGYLRDALPDSETPWLLADTETVQWNPKAPAEVDVLLFESLMREGRAREAVDLYAGDLLSDCYDDWILQIRERLRARYLTALWGLAVEARGKRDAPAARDYLQRILTEDSWREDAVRALMAVRYESGDRAGALRLCIEFEQRLSDEMHVPLMPETIALRRAIEHDEPLPTVPMRRAADTVKPTPEDLPFGGRDAEMARLADAWEHVLAGSGELVLITGEAGIGKTRLASEFALFVEGRGGRALWGTTSYPEAAPYQAVSEMLRAALGFVQNLKLDAYDRLLLSRLAPQLEAERGDARDGDDTEPARLFDAVATVFGRMAVQRPSLFVVEDVQNAGPATITMLEHVVSRIRGHPVLIVATAREAEEMTADTLGKLRRLKYGSKPQVVALSRLSENAVTDIVSRAPTFPQGDAEALSRLASVSGGHPLFLVELIHGVAEAGSMTTASPLPLRLRDAITERLGRLSPNARFLLGAASVVGNRFDLDVVGEVVGWSEAEFVTAADELVGRRAIRESANRTGFDFQFAHDLVASVAYDALTERERKRWHRRTARVAERYYAQRLDELAPFLARHHDLGGDAEAAATYYLQAARTAQAAFANEEALAYAARALALQPHSETLRFDLLELRVAVYDRLCDRVAQRAEQQKLDGVAKAVTDRQRRCEALRWRSLLHFRTGETEEGVLVAAELLRAAEGLPRWEGLALQTNAMFAAQRGDNALAYDGAASAAERFAAAESERELMSAVVFQALLAALLGRRTDALAALLKARQLAEKYEAIWFRLQVAYCETQVMTQFADWKHLAEPALELQQLATRIGDRMMLAVAHNALAVAFQRDTFDFASARRHFEEALELFKDAERAGQLTAYTNLAGVEIEIGRLERAARFADLIDADSHDMGGPVWPGYAAEIRAFIALRRNDGAEAMRWADRCVELAREWEDATSESQGLLIKGIVLREDGDIERAIDALTRSRERATAGGAPFFARPAAAELALTKALLDNADQCYRFAEEALGATEGIAGDAAAPASLSVLWPVARAFHALGDDERAGGLLSRAHELYLRQMNLLSEEEDRRAFAAVAQHVALQRAYAGGSWPEKHYDVAPRDGVSSRPASPSHASRERK